MSRRDREIRNLRRRVRELEERIDVLESRPAPIVPYYPWWIGWWQAPTAPIVDTTPKITWSSEPGWSTTTTDGLGQYTLTTVTN